MEYTKTISPEEFMEDLEKDSENGKTYEQLNAEHSYVAYVQTKEMVSTIKELGDEDDVNTAHCREIQYKYSSRHLRYSWNI